MKFISLISINFCEKSMLGMALRTSVYFWALGPKKKAATTAGFILLPMLK